MQVTIKKQINNIYYLKNHLSCVRYPYRKKDGTLGSKIGRLSKIRGVLFLDLESAEAVKAKHNCYSEKVGIIDAKYTFKYLEEIIVDGIKCYKAVI